MRKPGWKDGLLGSNYIAKPWLAGGHSHLQGNFQRTRLHRRLAETFPAALSRHAVPGRGSIWRMLADMARLIFTSSLTANPGPSTSPRCGLKAAPVFPLHLRLCPPRNQQVYRDDRSTGIALAPARATRPTTPICQNWGQTASSSSQPIRNSLRVASRKSRKPVCWEAAYACDHALCRRQTRQGAA